MSPSRRSMPLLPPCTGIYGFSTDTFQVAVREGVGGGAGSIVQLKRVQWRQGHAGTQLLSLLHLPAK